MIEKTGPTIYKGESIYKTGAGGGGPFPRLILHSDNTDKNTGWRVGENEILAGTTGMYGINTGLATYSLCPHINNAKKIYCKYQINFTTGVGGNSFRILDTDFEESYRLFTNWIYTDGDFSAYLKNGSTSIYSYERFIRFHINEEYKIENLLDVENEKFTININNVKLIDASIDKSLLSLNRYIPAWGMVPNYSTLLFSNGVKFNRSEFSYKLDGVEQIPQETLE